MSTKSWLWLMAVLSAAALFLALPLPVFAQNCALCYTQRASAGIKVIQALKSGILVLIVPPTLGSIGMVFLVHRRTHQYKRDNDAAEPGRDW